jgi:hypothetical protein
MPQECLVVDGCNVVILLSQAVDRKRCDAPGSLVAVTGHAIHSLSGEHGEHDADHIQGHHATLHM